MVTKGQRVGQRKPWTLRATGGRGGGAAACADGSGALRKDRSSKTRIRIRHLAAVAAISRAGTVVAPSALALDPAAAPAASRSAAAPSTAAAATATATTASTATAITPVGYADRTIRAFGARDDIDLARYTTADARRAIIAHEGAAKHWQRTGAEGAAGHVHVSYVNTETGDELTIGVDISDGTGHDHLVDTAR